MSEMISNFVASRLPISGLAAYSIHLPQQLLEIQCLSKSLYPSAIEAMLNRLVDAGRALLASGNRAAQYCWTFETHRVYVAGRADGVCLALLVENNPKTQLVRVQETLQEFLALAQTDGE